MHHISGARAALLVAALLVAPTLAAQVVINEIHHAPADKTVREEFVELYNAGAGEADLSGWFFSNGIDYTFPEGTSLAPGGYLVVAQNPSTLRSVFGSVPTVGPFEGRLDNDGEELILRDRAGGLVDVVDYGGGFPWPTAAGSGGFSIELVHPDLDNDLGGSWRISNPGAVSDSSRLIDDGARWRYLEGTAEASSPRSAWRQVGFDDGSWPSGLASVGYGEGFVRTVLDMRNNYASVFLRRTFEVDDPDAIGGLVLEVQYDDGFNAWINGTHVAGDNVPSNDLPFDATANSAIENTDFVEFRLPRPTYLRRGTNVLAVQLHNASIGGSSDAFLDVRLVQSAGAGAGPTPGARNSAFDVALPPHMRQVDHTPRQPLSDQPVIVTVKVTDDDGVASVRLHYQLVDPGSYIELGDPEYDTEWTTIDMFDDGFGADAIAADDIYTGLLPRALQQNRRLVRYRITAEDATGLAITAPYADDPQPNFAYFVYDGAPPWRGRVRAGSAFVDFPIEVTRSVPTYFLISKRSSVEDATWRSKYGGSEYRWQGTLVHDGRVYDHIRYRARGGVWRYAMGKNMWKFDFNRGHYLRARDDYGRRFRTTWDKLNFSAVIQQGNYLHRGEQGLFESVGFRLFNLAGVEAPVTSFAQFRIVDEREEQGATQYDGDLWGLYLVIEQMDGRFLDEHGLPDGNLYKMESGTGDLNNQGPTGATDKSDLNSFMRTYESNPPESWWRQNVDLDRYYAYRSIVEAIHHYDIAGGKNYFYYLDPVRDTWLVLPWDIDLTWANNMFGSGNDPFKSRVLGRSVFMTEYRNRIREIRDLLYNPDQTGQMIDEDAGVVNVEGGSLSFVDVDRMIWDYNPVMVDSSIINLSKAGHGRFYESGSPRSFEGMARLMKNYVVSRGSWIDSTIAGDSAIPRRPSVTYAGPDGFPVDALTFRSSNFSDPQGSSTFAGMKWRIAEVTPPGEPGFDPERPKLYEIEPAWELELDSFDPEVTIPAGALGVGSHYRVRVRMRDTSDRWSHWSSPVELATGPPLAPFPQQTSLRITELMYNPPEGVDHEFIEIQNVGDATVDLEWVSFTDGVEFSFAGSDVTSLPPGEFVLVVRNRRVFEAIHDTADMNIAGEYSGRLDNGGERIVLTFGRNMTILDFVYDDAWEPLTDSGGHSLTIVDVESAPETWGDPVSWKASASSGGSPGTDDGSAPVGGRQRPGDGNQDGLLDISDAISLLRRLFVGGAGALPCDGGLRQGGNLALLDVTGDAAVDVSDAIATLEHLFKNGPPPALGTGCVRLEGCPSVCR